MKKDRKGKLFFSLAGLMAVPILLLGVILVIVGRQSVSEGMELEIQKSLAGIARETIDVYGIAYPGEIRMEDERFYMGDADLTGDCALADRIKENTGADISIFWESVILPTMCLCTMTAKYAAWSLPVNPMKAW